MNLFEYNLFFHGGILMVLYHRKISPLVITYCRIYGVDFVFVWDLLG